MATLPELVLYHYWRSSSSWRVRWALAHKGLAYTPVSVNLLESEQAGAEHLARSPLGVVPALQVAGRSLSESVAICEYLEEIAPAPALLPADPWHRGRMRQLVEIINAGTQPVQNLLVLRKVSSERDAQAVWARFFIGRGLAAYQALLEEIRVEGGPQGAFSLGDAPTLADLCLVPQLYNARRFHLDLGPFARLVAIEEAAFATDACRVSAPPAWEPASP